MSISVVLAAVLAPTMLLAQNPEPGRVAFENRCGKCHGSDGKGGELGPSIVFRLSPQDDGQLAALIRVGLPSRGMPPSKFAEPEMAILIKFLRTIQRRPESKPVERRKVLTTDGRTLEGQVLGEGFDDLQLRTDSKSASVVSNALRVGLPLRV